MGFYLFYDVRGIQSFIFKIPKLKYIIGGSALIDQFDRETVKGLNAKGCECLFAGGGKGIFFCDDSDSVKRLQKQIVHKAGKIGLDIRFGCDTSFEKASRNSTELFPFIPSLVDGMPCPVSGLYPVKYDNDIGHETVQKRIFKHGTKTFRWFEDLLLKKNNEPLGYLHKIFYHQVG